MEWRGSNSHAINVLNDNILLTRGFLGWRETCFWREIILPHLAPPHPLVVVVDTVNFFRRAVQISVHHQYPVTGVPNLPMHHALSRTSYLVLR